MAAPRIVLVMSAASVPADPAPMEGDPCYGAQRRPVPLDVPDDLWQDTNGLKQRTENHIRHP